MTGRILAFCGGTGGVKLADGLQRAMPGGSLTIACNVGDDFEHLGLCISPDLDTVLYTLGGIENREQGWGRAEESWAALDEIARLGGDSWFRLGDKDIALHLLRTAALRDGETLSGFATGICDRLGIGAEIIPVTDDRLRTILTTDEGQLAFQDYFVRRQCAPAVSAIHFEGADETKPSPPLAAALDDPALEAILFCPSNPLLSIDPILAVAGLRQSLAARRVPAVAVSPVIGGDSVKGPTAKLMREMDHECSVIGIARHLAGLIDGLVIDHVDAGYDSELADMGLQCFATDILMRDNSQRQRLAAETLAFAREISV